MYAWAPQFLTLPHEGSGVGIDAGLSIADLRAPADRAKAYHCPEDPCQHDEQGRERRPLHDVISHPAFVPLLNAAQDATK